MKHLVIVGGGPAGLLAAITAAKRYTLSEAKIVLIEKNMRIGRKLIITGKGRCNLTNNCDLNTLVANTPKNSRFLYSAFSKFSPQDVMNFFENAGVALKTERGNRVFPVSDKAVDIVDALKNTADKLGIKIINGIVSSICVNQKRVKGVVLDNNETIPADSIVLATGGISYPLTGSTGDGFRFAKELGHTVTRLTPALVPIECHEGFCSILSGLSLKNIVLSVYEGDSNTAIFSEMGEMLFTHFGISGPLALSASSHIKKIGESKYIAKIDLKPALSYEQLDKRILRDFAEQAGKNFSNSLDKLLPKSLIPIIIRLTSIPPNLKVNQITREQRKILCSIVKEFPLQITGFRPIEEAIITSGGIEVKEINPATMESKLIKGLFFAGEIIDVDALTGGFNLQIAFSTGYVAGENI